VPPRPHAPFLAPLAALLLTAGAGAQTTVSWARWERDPGPAWRGTVIAADPSVVREDGVLRMVYTDWLEPPGRTVLAEAVSADGSTWRPAVDGPGGVPVVLDGRAGAWDDQIETGALLRRDGAYWLYYSGYVMPPPGVNVAYGAIGLAVSDDGVTFVRVTDRPVLAPEPGGLDADGAYSPSVRWWDGRAWMVYAGHCWNSCGEAGPGVRILGAVSEDGVHWTRHPVPVLTPADVPAWAAGGVGEPELVEGSDGLFYPFFSGFSDEPVRGWTGRIGVARSPHPFGPWEVAPEPVAAPRPEAAWEGTETIAPTVLIEGDAVRLWYHGRRRDPPGYAVGSARARWPLARTASPWRRWPANPVALPLGHVGGGETDLAIADPVVLRDPETGVFRAWWSTTVLGLYGPDGPAVNGIRYAESPDGVHWRVQPELAFAAAVGDPSAWDHTHAETPHVVVLPANPPGRRYLLYYSGGNRDACTVGEAPCYQVGLAFSADGRRFTRLPAAESPYGEAGLVLRGEDALARLHPALAVAADPAVLVGEDGILRMWLSSYAEDASGTHLAFGIALAESRDGIRWEFPVENRSPRCGARARPRRASSPPSCATRRPACTTCGSPRTARRTPPASPRPCSRHRGSGTRSAPTGSTGAPPGARGRTCGGIRPTRPSGGGCSPACT